MDRGKEAAFVEGFEKITLSVLMIQVCGVENIAEMEAIMTVLGGYTVHPEVGTQEMAVFQYAMKNHFGVYFNPVIVASQVVDGTNYLFVCTGKVVVPNAETKVYVIKIYTKFQHSIAPTVEILSIDELPIASLLDLKAGG